MSIHDLAVVDPAAKIGQNVSIGPFCVIGPEVVLGDGVVLHNSVTITGRTRLGEGVEVFPGAVIGHLPQILGFEDGPGSRIDIGPRTILREQVTIHPGSPEEGGLTSVGADCFIMVGVHIAHDCRVGDRCVFANNVALGGHVQTGEQVWIGGLSGIHQYTRLGDHCFVGTGASVVEDVIPFGSVIGNRANLSGLNIVGLKRRGFPRRAIHDLRAAYRMLFADEGTFQERLSDARRTLGDCEEVALVIDFIENGGVRPLCMPG